VGSAPHCRRWPHARRCPTCGKKLHHRQLRVLGDETRITATQLPGPYRHLNYRVTFTSLYTNTVTCTPYRGAGRPQYTEPT
jgi:CO/xanthine dehydrogenase Mo-binding subunit